MAYLIDQLKTSVVIYITASIISYKYLLHWYYVAPLVLPVNSPELAVLYTFA